MVADIEKRLLVRHIIATLAYRAAKIFQNVPEEFAKFEAGHKVRTPLAIMAHLNLLIDLANRQFDFAATRLESNRTRTWKREIALFYSLLETLDKTIAEGIGPGADLSIEQIIQGPIADAMTHLGQLATLRRLAGDPVQGESYWKANIRVGHVGPDQPLQSS